MSPSIFRRPLGLAFSVLLLASSAVATVTAAQAETIDTQARQAIILDYRTGAVLMEKNADELMAPSSMSKLMTIYMVFSRLKDGSLRMTDTLPVSETAWRKYASGKSGASMMFVPLRAQVRVDDLLRGVIIQSGNDACSVLAEGLAGSEESFSEQATRKGKEIGLTHSTFRNASGWPDPAHRMTARDLSTLARHLISDFPEYYPIFAEKSFTYNNIKQDNRNPLIWQNIPGADGLKTGHTEEGGFGLTGSAQREGRRVILVLNGLPTQKSRTEESERLIEWAFREFDDYSLFKAGENVSDADVWLGVEDKVPLTVANEVLVSLPRTARHDMKVSVSYNGPVPAPIVKGQEIATLVVSAPGVPDTKVPLIAAANVEKLGFFGRIGAALHHLVSGPKG